MGNVSHWFRRFLLFPLHLALVLMAVCLIGCFYIFALHRSYIAVVCINVVRNFFHPSSRDFDEQRKRHMHILGATGSGKSSLIEYCIDQNVSKNQGFVLIEPHGELASRVLHHRRFALGHSSQAHKKLIHINFDHSPPALNFFDLPLPTAKNERMSMVDALSTELSDALCMNMRPTASEAQWCMLHHLIMLGLYSPSAKVTDLLAWLSKDGAQEVESLLQNLPSEVLQSYFHRDFIASGNIKTKEALRLRMSHLLVPQSLFMSLGAKSCDIDFERILSEGRFVVIQSSSALLGSYQAKTIGNIFMNVLNFYAFKRLGKTTHIKPFFVYVDEAQYYINPALQRALTGVRKTGLSYTLAHQELYQEAMSTGQQRTIIHNTAVKLYGSLQWKDKQEAKNILGLSSVDILDALRVGQFVVKLPRRVAYTQRFPAKFAVPRPAFGKGWLINVYMSEKQYKQLLSVINSKQQANNSIAKNNDYTKPSFSSLSFKSFSVDGATIPTARRN